VTPDQLSRLYRLLERIERQGEIDEWLARVEFEEQLELTGSLQEKYGQTRSDDDYIAWQIEIPIMEMMFEALHKEEKQ
jgi:hypothetical protein